MKYTDFTIQQLLWLDRHFDSYQEQFAHKWKILGRQMKEKFRIHGSVKEVTVRNKLIAFWVCIGLY